MPLFHPTLKDKKLYGISDILIFFYDKNPRDGVYTRISIHQEIVNILLPSLRLQSSRGMYKTSCKCSICKLKDGSPTLTIEQIFNQSLGRVLAVKFSRTLLSKHKQKQSYGSVSNEKWCKRNLWNAKYSYRYELLKLIALWKSVQELFWLVR